MLTFLHKIAAIKHVRDMFRNRDVQTEQVGGVVANQVLLKVSIQEPTLKESKDLVEAIMLLGVRYFIEDSKSFMNIHGAKEMIRSLNLPGHNVSDVVNDSNGSNYPSRW